MKDLQLYGLGVDFHDELSYDKTIKEKELLPEQLDFGMNKKLLKLQLNNILGTEESKRIFLKIKDGLKIYSNKVAFEELDLLSVVGYLFVTGDLEENDLPVLRNFREELYIFKLKYEKGFLQIDGYESNQMEQLTEFLLQELRKYVTRAATDYETIEKKYDEIIIKNHQVIEKFAIEFSFDYPLQDYLQKLFIGLVYMIVVEGVSNKFISNQYGLREKLFELQTKYLNNTIGDGKTNWKFGFKKEKFVSLNGLPEKEEDLLEKIKNMIQNDRSIFSGITGQIYLKKVLGRTGLLRIKDVVESLGWMNELGYCSYIQLIRLEHLFRIRDGLAQIVIDKKTENYRGESGFDKFIREHKIKPVSKINRENLKDIYFKIFADIVNQKPSIIQSHNQASYSYKIKNRVYNGTVQPHNSIESKPEIPLISELSSSKNVGIKIENNDALLDVETKILPKFKSFQQIKTENVVRIIDNFDDIKSSPDLGNGLSIRFFDNVDELFKDDEVLEGPESDYIPTPELLDLSINELKASLNTNLYSFVCQNLVGESVIGLPQSILETNDLISFLKYLSNSDEIKLHGKAYDSKGLYSFFLDDIKGTGDLKGINQNLTYLYRSLKEQYLKKLFDRFYQKNDFIGSVNLLGEALFKINNFYYLQDAEIPLVQNEKPEIVENKGLFKSSAIKHYDNLKFNDNLSSDFEKVYQDLDRIKNPYFIFYYKFVYDMVGKCESSFYQCASYYTNIFVEIVDNLNKSQDLSSNNILNKLRVLSGYIMFLLQVTGGPDGKTPGFYLKTNEEKGITTEMVSTLIDNLQIFNKTFADLKYDLLDAFVKKNKKLSKKLEGLANNVLGFEKYISQFEEGKKLLNNSQRLLERLNFLKK